MSQKVPLENYSGQIGTGSNFKKIDIVFKRIKKRSILAKSTNIHPIFDRLLSREEREQRLGQKGKVLWMTGLSGSGKSTIAQHLERRLFEAGFFPQVLDGDNIPLRHK